MIVITQLFLELNLSSNMEAFIFYLFFFFIRNYEDVAYFVYKLLTYIVDIGFDIARLEHSYTQRNCQFEYRSIVFQGISKFS